jgi:1,4-alpha-glucan branching enzyme
MEEQDVFLTFFSSDAKSVQVAGTFNRWHPAANPLDHDGAGEWSTVLKLRPGQYEYRFLVDGAWVDDPQATQTAANPFGGLNSLLYVGLDERTDQL